MNKAYNYILHINDINREGQKLKPYVTRTPHTKRQIEERLKMFNIIGTEVYYCSKIPSTETEPVYMINIDEMIKYGENSLKWNEIILNYKNHKKRIEKLAKDFL